MRSLELTAAITALANALARSLTPTEAALLANLLVELGDTINTVLSNEALLEERESNGE